MYTLSKKRCSCGQDRGHGPGVAHGVRPCLAEPPSLKHPLLRGTEGLGQSSRFQKKFPGSQGAVQCYVSSDGSHRGSLAHQPLLLSWAGRSRMQLSWAVVAKRDFTDPSGVPGSLCWV